MKRNDEQLTRDASADVLNKIIKKPQNHPVLSHFPIANDG